jgi:tetratricopeptide (TPR) repeat protein
MRPALLCLQFIFLAFCIKSQPSPSHEKIRQLIEDKEYKSAELEIEKTFANDTSNLMFYYYSGLLERKRQNKKKAIRFLSGCIKKDSTFLDPYGLIAAVYRENDDFERSDAFLDLALKRDPYNLRLMNDRAVNFYLQGKLDEALDLFTKAFRDSLNDPMVMYNIGTTLRMMGRLEEAMPYFTYALKGLPRDAKVYFDKGYTEFLLEKYAEALEDFEKSLEYNDLIKNEYERPDIEETKKMIAKCKRLTR